jgi:hypothetical protein
MLPDSPCTALQGGVAGIILIAGDCVFPVNELRQLRPRQAEHCYASHHARVRILERYGFIPTELEWMIAFLDVTDQRTILTRRERDREYHYVRIGVQIVRAVYCPESAQFITVLPLSRPKAKRVRVKRIHIREELDDAAAPP